MNERELFVEALNHTDPAARSEFLDQACRGDCGLRARMDELLAGYRDVVSVLERNPARLLGLAEPAASEVGEDPGESTIAPEIQLQPFLEPATRPDSLGRLGHYELLQVVGHGGFGVVVKAFDDHLHRIVAVKILMPHLAKTSPPRKRFLREARSAALVRHEHVIEIYAVEELPLPYLVMEYIDGRSLQQHVDEFGPLDPAEVVRLGRQIALGLAAAHERGIVHRDVKPANILLETGSELRVKLTDFGVARTVDEACSTQSGLLAGTPLFMAPEQIRGERVDHRADLFSLGSVLYTMIVGRPPFRASNTFAILRRVVEDTPRPIADVMPNVPEGLQAVIACLHKKDRAERFESADDVAEALSSCLQGSVALPAPHRPRPRWKRPLLAALMICVLVAAGWTLGQFAPLPEWGLSGARRPSDAPVTGPGLTGADLTGAGLTGADLTGADLTGAGRFPRRQAAKPVVDTQRLEAVGAAGRQAGMDADSQSPLRRESSVPPDAERWEQAVALMPAEDRLQAVLARLKKLNPECVDPKPQWHIEDDAVVAVALEDSYRLLDLTPVRALRELRELRLIGQEHLDLEPLRGMRLTRFDSNGNLIKDLTPLSGMPLEWLGVWGYARSDLSALRGMKSLTGLNCGASDVRDLSPLRGLPLTYLCLNRTQVRDVSPLAEMPLRTLELEYTYVSDLTPIAELPLERLFLQGTPIADYAPLAKMPLKTLRLDYQPEVHQTLLRSIETLETVNFQPVAEFLGGTK